MWLRRLRAAKTARASYVPFESALPNDCSQSDMTHWQLESGAGVEIVNFIDDYSRAMLCSAVVSVIAAADVARLFYESAATYGLPTSLLTDNGGIYTAADRGSHAIGEVRRARSAHRLKPLPDAGQDRALPPDVEEVAEKTASGTDHRRAPDPDRPLRVHLQRGASALGSRLSTDAGLAQPRQGNARDLRTPHPRRDQSSPRRHRQDRSGDAPLSLETAPHRRWAGTAWTTRPDLDGRPRCPHRR